MANDTTRAMDRLMDESRVMGESRMIREPDQVTRESAQAVIERFQDFKLRTNLSGAFVARSLGISQGTLSQVITWTYKGNWQQVVIDLDKWLEDEAKRDAAPKPTEFVWTRVAEEIQTVAEAAITLKTIGLVYGDTGIGKSLALLAIAADKPGSILLSVETAAASAAGLVEELGRALRAHADPRRASTRHTLQRVKDMLKGTSRLLIVDEIHKLCSDAGTQGNDKALHVLRDLHDHTGIPMLLCGTTDLVGYLERRQVGGREPLGQIRRRIGICRDLAERTTGDDGGPGEPLFSVEEVRKVFAKSKMRLAPDAARYLMHLANLPGSGALGTCKNLVIMATKVHGAKGDVLTADLLRSVHRLLVSRRTMQLLEARIEQATPRAVARAG